MLYYHIYYQNNKHSKTVTIKLVSPIIIKFGEITHRNKLKDPLCQILLLPEPPEKGFKIA